VVRARVLRKFDPWNSPLCTCPPKYSLQPYTGCSHMCLYCYATSYIGRRRSRPKKDFIRNLSLDLLKADPSLPVSMSNSSDPYPPEESSHLLTREALKLLKKRGFRVLIVTKSSLVMRDSDILTSMKAAVTITITTLDESLARKLEPGAPPPRDRVKAVEKLVELGIPVGLRLDPVIPYLNDDAESIREVIEAINSVGVNFVVTSTFKARPDSLKRMCEAFPELCRRWVTIYREEGEWIHGYWYAPRTLRAGLLRIVIEEARKRGMKYAVCREGFRGPEWFNAPTCDGTHLIPKKVLF